LNDSPVDFPSAGIFYRGFSSWTLRLDFLLAILFLSGFFTGVSLLGVSFRLDLLLAILFLSGFTGVSLFGFSFCRDATCDSLSVVIF